jgi:hypothetical protein
LTNILALSCAFVSENWVEGILTFKKSGTKKHFTFRGYLATLTRAVQWTSFNVHGLPGIGFLKAWNISQEKEVRKWVNMFKKLYGQHVSEKLSGITCSRFESTRATEEQAIVC